MRSPSGSCLVPDKRCAKSGLRRSDADRKAIFIRTGEIQRYTHTQLRFGDTAEPPVLDGVGSAPDAGEASRRSCRCNSQPFWGL